MYSISCSITVNKLRFIPNYPINLIAPANINDHDFGKFHTDLGLAMKVLKYQNSRVDQILINNVHETVDRSAAVFLNKVASTSKTKSLIV